MNHLEEYRREVYSITDHYFLFLVSACDQMFSYVDESRQPRTHDISQLLCNGLIGQDTAGGLPVHEPSGPNCVAPCRALQSQRQIVDTDNTTYTGRL